MSRETEEKYENRSRKERKIYIPSWLGWILKIDGDIVFGIIAAATLFTVFAILPLVESYQKSNIPSDATWICLQKINNICVQEGTGRVGLSEGCSKQMYVNLECASNAYFNCLKCRNPQTYQETNCCVIEER